MQTKVNMKKENSDNYYVENYIRFLFGFLLGSLTEKRIKWLAPLVVR